MRLAVLLVKDKLFWFGNYEYQDIGQSGQYFLCTPTAAGLATLKTMPGLNQTNLGIYEKYTPASLFLHRSLAEKGEVISPAATVPPPETLTGAAIRYRIYRRQFSTRMPARPIQANIAPGAGDYGTGGATNIPLGNYLVAAPNFNNYKNLVTSADWTISPKDSFRGRYIYNNDQGIDTAAALPAFFLPIPHIYHLIALSEYHDFTPNFINEARVQVSSRYYNITPAGSFSFASSVVGFPNLTFDDQGATNVGPDPNAPQSTVQNLYQLTDNVSYVHGKHTFKFGFDGRKYIAPQTFTQRVRGDYQYNYLTEYLNDVAPTNFGERSAGNFIYYGDETAFYGYGNDTWRVTEKMTLNLGLRYEYTAVPVGERAQALNIKASAAGLVTFASPQPQMLKFFPRVGFNYAVDPNTSVRAGFGMAGDILDDNLRPALHHAAVFVHHLAMGTAGHQSPGDPAFLAGGGLPSGTGSLEYLCHHRRPARSAPFRRTHAPSNRSPLTLKRGALACSTSSGACGPLKSATSVLAAFTCPHRTRSTSSPGSRLPTSFLLSLPSLLRLPWGT